MQILLNVNQGFFVKSILTKNLISWLRGKQFFTKWKN